MKLEYLERCKENFMPDFFEEHGRQLDLDIMDRIDDFLKPILIVYLIERDIRLEVSNRMAAGKKSIR